MAPFLDRFRSKAPPVTFEELRAAQARLRTHLQPTPLIFSPTLSEVIGHEIYLKLENRFRTGSFKERGALNVLSILRDKNERPRVCAVSAGNHALALSYHAQRLKIPCSIVMPVHAPLVKVQSTRMFGAEVVLHGATLSEALDHALKLSRQRDAVFISPFDDPGVIAGQGTCGLELVDQLDEFDAVVVPVGGGGLISGIALALKELRPSVYVLGTQSAWAVAARAEQQIKNAAPQPAPATIADGIAVKTIGKYTAPIIAALVDHLTIVNENEIAEAVVKLLETERMVVEGAGAAGIAALLHGKLTRSSRRTVVIISGSNIDINVLARLIDRDMAHRGRLLRIHVAVPDRPGSLALATGIIAEQGANVLQVMHDRSWSELPGNVDVTFLLEVRDDEHKSALVAALEEKALTVREQSTV